MDAERLNAGEIVDERFRLEKRLGSGAFATVWSAIDLRSNGKVAIKILHQELAEHPLALQRFQREIDVLARLDHPNVARAISAGADDRCRYLAMELVEGQTLLDDLIDTASNGTQYSITEIREVCGAIADALDHAHSLGIIHRDLKPANVMIRRADGKLVPTILDFGIAKAAVELSDQTTLGRRLGTLMYMSPEQLRGEAIDARTDVFALGVILFEMLTLRRPFARDANETPLHFGEATPHAKDLNSHAVVMKRIAAEERPKPSAYRTGLGSRADEVLLRALDHAPKNRFASAGELMEAFADAIRNPLGISPRAAMEETNAAEVEAPTATPVPVDPTRVAPRALTSVEPPPTTPLTAPLVRVRESSLSRRWALPALLFAVITAATAVAYVQASEPVEIAAETIEPEAPVVLPRETIEAPQIEAAPKVEEPLPAEPPPPIANKAKAKVRPPPPAPEPERRRDPAIAQMLDELRSDDPAVIARVARKLEEASDRLADRDAQVSMKRCAAMSALRAEKRELLRCIERFEEMLR